MISRAFASAEQDALTMARPARAELSMSAHSPAQLVR
jgi:hypothetical protein